MRFSTDLIPGRLIRRYKRFLADVLLDDGAVVTAHCANSGSMKSCLEEGAEVWLSQSGRPGRKTPYTWEIDPAYTEALDEAVRQGVEVLVAQARVSPQGIAFHRLLPFKL